MRIPTTMPSCYGREVFALPPKSSASFDCREYQSLAGESIASIASKVGPFGGGVPRRFLSQAART